jgi:transposase-like protein
MGYLIVSQGVLVVCAVRQTDGLLEILTVQVADTESEATYQEMFRLLKEVGFCLVQLVVSYDYDGLKAAMARYFQGASHPRCLASTTVGTTSGWSGLPSARSLEEPVVDSEEAMIMEQ